MGVSLDLGRILNSQIYTGHTVQRIKCQWCGLGVVVVVVAAVVGEGGGGFGVWLWGLMKPSANR